MAVEGMKNILTTDTWNFCLQQRDKFNIFKDRKFMIEENSSIFSTPPET